MKEMIEGIKHVIEEQKRVKELTEGHCFDGIIGITSEGAHVCQDKLIEVNGGFEGIEYKDRPSTAYPYEVFAYVDGIKFFSIITYADADDTFKEVIQEDRITKLEAELAKLKGVEQDEQSV
jgi:hypothetical protein